MVKKLYILIFILHLLVCLQRKSIIILKYKKYFTKTYFHKSKFTINGTLKS